MDNAYTNVKRTNGVAALVVVVVIGAAALLMGLTSAALGLGELESGYTAQKSSEAFGIADGCLEETYRHIRLDTGYGVGAGTINLTVDNGSCTIVVTDLGSGQRRIVATGSTGDYHKKIQAEITLSGNVITINSWQELAT